MAHELGLGDLGQLRRPLAAAPSGSSSSIGTSGTSSSGDGATNDRRPSRERSKIVIVSAWFTRDPSSRAGDDAREPVDLPFVRRSVIATSRPSSYSG